MTELIVGAAMARAATVMAHPVWGGQYICLLIRYTIWPSGAREPKAMSDSAFREGQSERQDLVSTKWLGERLGCPDVALVDASVAKSLGNDGAWLSDRPAFEEGHIPSGRFADLISDFSEPEGRLAFTRPTAARFAAAAARSESQTGSTSLSTTTPQAYGPRDSGGFSRPSVTIRSPCWTAAWRHGLPGAGLSSEAQAFFSPRILLRANGPAFSSIKAKCLPSSRGERRGVSTAFSALRCSQVPSRGTAAPDISLQASISLMSSCLAPTIASCRAAL
jgi:hypothetical protein